MPPETASAMLLRSGVVATTSGSARAVSPRSQTPKARRTARPPSGRGLSRTAMQPCLTPETLGHHAMDSLVAVAMRRDAAIHRHAEERVGIEPRQTLLVHYGVD